MFRIADIQVFIQRKIVQNILKSIYKDVQSLINASIYELYKKFNQIISIKDRIDALSKYRYTRSNVQYFDSIVILL